MKNNKVKQLLEYLSLTLVLSYFFIHNIFLVFIGIYFSFYLINIKIINKLVRNAKGLPSVKIDRELNKNDKAINNNSIQVKASKDDCDHTLAETVEELGFIPTNKSYNNIDAA